MEKVLAIVGPTAVGKTALSIELAKKYHGEIISGDSMQVYRGLDIGTAKVTAQEKQGIVHHLIDIRNIDERFSVADFVSLSQKLISEINRRGHLPIIVGGTGFYLNALLDGLTLGGDSYDQNETVRNKWREFAAQNGHEALWQKLHKVDPEAAAKIPVSNERRIIRALEVFERTGKKISSQEIKPDSRYDALVIGLNTEREVLYNRINQRVDLMMKAGLEQEARTLFTEGGFNFQAGKGIGYRELFPYFEGKAPLIDAVNDIKLDSRHYAKRQLTWFRNKLDVNWFNLVQNPDEIQKIKETVADWL
ncbi:tRNA (adenosine(37)-N6)-dimethylallyltransferase MiaA [Secundilactobacillus malefermentans]|uniref:tRNA (adenosine(37)-N6)-dimethylallyltransferase MiaA n=1 Tax=Secundilactobacillus malefermentans TaxID=176292 RepID=UPI0011CC525E|nr:tRNA (adenosine(37)-N6)-dimethylallyltransferase MiaA [Secundilactobacillus malefermentans]QEA30692.1 tRNA (adenosine(37)-N6)-dimethylallyltransferase MiaA [Secundilactobacillus malefermentans]